MISDSKQQPKNGVTLKKLASIISGFGAISSIWGYISKSTASMVHADPNVERVTDQPDEYRLQAAKRLQSEAIFFFLIAIIGMFGGLVGASTKGFLYILSGLIAMFFATAIGVLKLWQSQMIASGKPVQFLAWIGIKH